MGIKWAVSVSLSTTTHIASKLCHIRGKPFRKSIMMCSNFYSEIGSGTNKPGGFICLAFTCWQSWHFPSNSVMSLFIPSYQKLCRGSWYILVLSRNAVYGMLWASHTMSSLNSLICGIHIRYPYFITPLSMWSSMSFSFSIRSLILLNWLSSICALTILSRRSNWTLTWYTRPSRPESLAGFTSI